MRPLYTLLYLLAGVDRDAIKDAGNKEKNSYLILGVVVLIPAIMAWFGMYHQIYWIGYEGLYRICICTLWSLMILSIDILMVSTMNRPENIFKKVTIIQTITFFAKALFRLSISILLGYIISQPLILKHYEAEINGELINIKKTKVDSLEYNNKLKITYFSYNDSLRLKDLESLKKCLEFLLTCERSGKDTILPCGKTSPYVGRGFRYDSLDNRLNEVKKQIHSSDSILNKIKAEKDRTNNILTDSIEHNYSKGYAIRQQALDNLEIGIGGNNIASRHFWFLLLLIFIDSVAVIMKILMPFGKHDKELEERRYRDSAMEALAINSDNDEILVTRIKDDRIRQIKIDAINLSGTTPYTAANFNNRLNKLKLHIDEILETWNYKRRDLGGDDIRAPRVVPTDQGKFSLKYKNYFEAILSFVFLLLIVYKLKVNDITWFATWGSIFSSIYMGSLELYRSFFKH